MNGAEMKKVSIKEAFETFTEQWSPKIVGEVNESYVKRVRFKGEFVWHHHEVEDEMFLVVKGTMLMRLRDQDITVEEGEFIIIPRGVEHMPVAEEEAQVLLFEPRTTLNTGNVQNERTLAELERIS
jgi:mannose-6-phosphate isomerase-like protein (cupin superfamily)